MIESFKGKGTKDIALRSNSKEARKLLPVNLHGVAQGKLFLLDSAISLESLRAFRGLKLEKLLGNRKDQWSIRINQQYRVCFRWQDGNAVDVEIVDYH